MKTMIFQGYLRDLYPDGISVNASSAADAVALLSNYPGFRTVDGVRHKVCMPDFPTRDSFYHPTDKEVLEIIPVDENAVKEYIEGAGGNTGAWVQVIIGAVIMYFTYGQYPQLFLAGMGLVLGGLLQLMMPQPPKSGNENDPRSNYLAANRNTVAVGTTIPIAFGRRRVYGHLLSFNVTATNLNAPDPAAPSGAGAAAGGAIGSTIDYDGFWSTNE